MNKRSLLIVILAGILAFTISYYFLHSSNKQVEQNIQQQNITGEESQDNINNEKEDFLKLTEEEKNLPKLETIPAEQAKPNMINIRSNIENNKKQTINATKEETTKIKDIETTYKETKHEESYVKNNSDEDGVIIPVSYKSKNTYKYVYTPTSFKNK